MLPPDRGPVLIPYFNVTINVVDPEEIFPVLVSYFDISTDKCGGSEETSQNNNESLFDNGAFWKIYTPNS